MALTDAQLDAALTFMKTQAAAYGEAKACRVYLTEYRKVLKAKLYGEAPAGSVSDRENWAYAHGDYHENLIGLKAAISEEAELRWKLTAAQVQCELYRTQESSRRNMVSSAA